MMKSLLIFTVVFVVGFYIVRAEEASRLGPEERRTLLDDDVTFEENLNHRNNNFVTRQEVCARDNEDCSSKSCCSQCTRCSCNRSGKNCRCSGKNELALFLGLCRR